MEGGHAKGRVAVAAARAKDDLNDKAHGALVLVDVGTASAAKRKDGAFVFGLASAPERAAWIKALSPSEKVEAAVAAALPCLPRREGLLDLCSAGVVARRYPAARIASWFP